MGNILQLLAALFVFVLVLVATYYVTKWIAKTGALQPYTRNIQVIETYKVAPNKYIQLIRIGEKYYSIGVTKDNITFLSEVEETQLNLDPIKETVPVDSFKEVWNRVSKTIKDKQKKQ
nr:flagellar biosynthetic protein FliO [Eubacterium sp.]